MASGDWIGLTQHPFIYLMPEWAIALAGAKPREIRVALASNPWVVKLPDVVEKLSGEYWAWKGLDGNEDVKILPDFKLREGNTSD